VGGEAVDGDLVEGKGVRHAPVGIGGRQPQRVNGERGGGANAFKQAVGPVLVHEESDGAAVHAKDRPAELQVLVDRVEQEAVAAEGHDDLAVVGVDQVIAGREFGLGRARRRRARRHAGDARFGRDPGHGAALLRSPRPPWSSETGRMRTRRPRPALVPRSDFAGFRFPPEVIVVAVRWYLRFGLSYRDVEELLAERGVEVDHVSIYRWVQRFTPLLADAARPCRHLVGDRWQVDETYVKVAGRWRYVYRAIDQFGQVIDVFVAPRRDADAADRFFKRAIDFTRVRPVEVTSDRAPVYPAVLEALLPAAWHRTDQYANNRVECDHGRLKARLRPMRGLKQDRSARVVIAGHALVQNVRRGHYELAVEEPATRRLAVAFDELALTI
jgi:transposase-like protein